MNESLSPLNNRIFFFSFKMSESASPDGPINLWQSKTMEVRHRLRTNLMVSKIAVDFPSRNGMFV